ncbi:hypothetical protein EBT31_19540 [bacterium]|jgi:hypothetical protein|nr:hypothetical protein [bacterium]
MTTYVWTVTRLWTLPQVDGETDVVVNAAYNVVGTDGEYTASLDNTQQFTYTGGAFTPFDQLTQDQVIGWIQAALGENGIISVEACIQGQIDSKKNPPVSPAQQPLPWAAQ